MSAAQFLFDRDEELWWIDEAADGGTHEPDAGHFVRDVPDEMLAELLAVRRRYATLIEELPAAAGLAAATATLLDVCADFAAREELTAENTTHLNDPALLDRMISWQRCTTCGYMRSQHVGGEMDLTSTASLSDSERGS